MPTLAAIAQDMTDQARRTGAATRTLAHGLHLQLAWVAGSRFWLRVARRDGPPGAMEIQICRDVFGVPAGADREEGERAVTFRWPSGGMP